MITGINIFILFFVMSYFLFNPAREVLEKRRKRIAGDLETAKTSREDALTLKAEYEDKIKSIDKEAQEILDAARKKAKKQEADILSEAREEANRIVDRANREIELEKKKALEDMKTEIVSIASLMAEKAVAASMDVKIQDSLIPNPAREILITFVAICFNIICDSALFSTYNICREARHCSCDHHHTCDCHCYHLFHTFFHLYPPVFPITPFFIIAL